MCAKSIRKQEADVTTEEHMEERTSLEKTLKPHWVWAIALGSAIGWGAFVQPIEWMKTAGPVGVMIGFGIGALLMILIAVSYGVLIKSFPVSGGEFAYAFLSFGRTRSEERRVGKERRGRWVVQHGLRSASHGR